MENRFQLNLVVLLLAWLLPISTITAAECTPWAAKIASVQGKIEVKHARTSNWYPVNRNDTLCPGDSIRVGDQSRAAIVLANQTLLRLDQNSAIKLTQFETAAPSILEFIMGIGHFISREPRSLKVKTAAVNAAIEGTEFVVTVSANETSVTVFEGTVLTQNQQGEMSITDGETVIAKTNSAPVKTLLAKPRDTVQWALYFPPIIEMVKPNRLSRASQLLYVGRVKEAQTLLQGMNSGEALALQTIIAIVNNETDRAFKLASDAVQKSPQSAATHIALSYAWQAKLELKQALGSAQMAVKNEPNNAIAWARLAELQLSSGDLDEALASAQQATQLNANLSRTQSILGYAYLVRIDIDAAIEVFNQAIELDQVDPLPRLGLGLARIRENNLKQGRREIEIAASLDPNNAIIRSYLGKAYFEEKRDPLDASQFAMAKQLDPNDPTPFYYDAIRKQTINRPVEALHDLQKSIELNDNRAVYRSSLLLDEDLAARSASLGRIFRNLGFEQLALVEGYKSVNSDPSDYSGHRFLADTYSALPRHEIARVSELLQSQLLQPINLTPLQPQLAESNLLLLRGAGPSDSAFSEFNPLFTHDRLAFQVNGIVAGNNTVSEDLVLSGIQGKTSFSLGQFHYETDGFRNNNDQTEDIYNVFVQANPSPKISLQAEYRQSDTENGDLTLNFDPDNFLPNRRTDSRSKSARVGFRYQLNPSDNIIGSVIYKERDSQLTDRTEDIFPGLQLITDIDSTANSEGNSAELQYLHRAPRSNLTIGTGHVDEDQPRVTTVTITTIIPPLPPSTTTEITPTDRDGQHTNAYVYYSFGNALNTLTTTIGFSLDSFKEEPKVDKDQFNPKLGLIWTVTPATTLRFAAFDTVKRLFISDQTIEPTQVAGFNQFFDDIDFSETTRYGLGLDQVFSPRLYAGVEFSARDIEEPRTRTDGATGMTIRFMEEQDEKFHRAYFYWTATDRFALSAEYLLEKFDRKFSAFSRPNLPSGMTTHRVPLAVNYYHPNGFSSTLKATYVDQDVGFFATSSNAGGSDRFWVVDASVGYRLPKSRGLISVGVKNLFNEEFRFQDTNSQNGAVRIPLFQPDQLVFARLTLSL